MTRIVVDASIIAAILFDDETSLHDDSMRAAIRDADLVVPAHCPIELTSLLLKAERRGRMTLQRRDEHFETARTLLAPAEVETSTMSLAVLHLATEARLSGYDAACLALALRTGATLATNDHALIAAARERGLPVLSTRA